MNEIFKNTGLIELFKKLYVTDENVEKQKERYNNLIEAFKLEFKNEDFFIFSTPGRTEIGGNHTDHNHGRVIAGSIDLDSIAVVNKTDNNIVTIKSEGFEKKFIVDLQELDVNPDEEGSTNALIRGIAAKYKEEDHKIGGFDAYIASDVFSGSGLSSSASIEVLIGTIFNGLYNNNSIDPVEIAKIGQYAENVYFMKPCGLMDQVACAVGGIVTIDFKSTEDPIVNKVDFDFASKDYSVVVVNTGGSHADLTGDYASIPIEMKSVAKYFEKEVCRGIEYEDLLNEMKALRGKTGDRAILRVMHFLNDNARVIKQVEALNKNDFKLFLKYVTDSGNSSWKWLQNCFTNKKPDEQGVTLALAVTENFIDKLGEGACRVHGGGFAGTIQCFLPNRAVKEYSEIMSNVFDKNAVTVLSIRPVGTTQIWPVV